jgi:Protein of unknown function (DUF3800)
VVYAARVYLAMDGRGVFDVDRAPPGKPGVIAAVVVAKRHHRAVEQHVREKCFTWEVPELHAHDLSLEQLTELCAWVGTGDQIVWTAALTDAALFPSGLLSDWRDRQAQKLLDAVADVAGARVQEVMSGRPLSWHLARIRPGGRRSLRTPHYVEHLFVLPRTIGDAVQASIDAYDGPAWSGEFDAMTLLIDSSSAGDARAQVRDLLKPILASNDLALAPPRLSGVDHPVFSKHVRAGRRGDILSLLDDRICFVESHLEPLCQLADLAAWVVRRYAERPGHPHAARLYRLLQPRQHGINGRRGVRIMSMRGIPADRALPYTHVSPAGALGTPR